ncbi:MAG: hypothetical protein NTZ03_15770 [Actinobacteria bacterium]|nr:hypothetical protein [Actinomycetota bacterium]
MRKTNQKIALGIVAALTVALSACGSNAKTASSTSASPTAAPADCSTESILKALPAGSTMVKYKCADEASITWAAAAVNPGPTVFFLQLKNGSWSAQTANAVCGNASAGLPAGILDFCRND